MTAAADTKAESAHDAVAVTYAKALLGALDGAGQTAVVLPQFDSFVGDVWKRLPDLAGVLSSGLVSPDEKAALIQKAVGGQAAPLLLNFLLVLAKHDRLAALPAIQAAVRSLLDQQRGVVRVKVITADPLEAAQLTQLQQSLTGLLGGTPVLDNQIDPSIIGGIVLRVGDKVLDGSMAAQLQRVREQMINRSVHEIQSRRDRFSTAEGN